MIIGITFILIILITIISISIIDRILTMLTVIFIVLAIVAMSAVRVLSAFKSVICSMIGINMQGTKGNRKLRDDILAWGFQMPSHDHSELLISH